MSESAEGIIPHGSREEPVPVPVRDDYHKWEYAEIRKAIGKSKRIRQALMHPDDRLIDRILMETPKGEQHAFYFDVTDNIANVGKLASAAARSFKHKGPQPKRNDPCPCGSSKKFKKCCGVPRSVPKMADVLVKTPWGEQKVYPSPHGSPRVIETLATHPDFVGVGLKKTPQKTWEKVVFVLKSQAAVDSVKGYLENIGEAKQKFFAVEYVVASSKDDVDGIIKWLK